MTTRTMTRKETKIPSAAAATVKPTKQDFLVGSEYFCQENHGNVLFRQLVEKHFAAYEQAARKLKGKIKKQVVDEIKARGGRFLQRVDDGNRGRQKQQHHSLNELRWREMSDKEAMKKVVDGFGYERKKNGGILSRSAAVSAAVSAPVAAEDDRPSPTSSGTAIPSVSVTKHAPQSCNDPEPAFEAPSNLAKLLEEKASIAELTHRQQGKRFRPTDDAQSFPSVPSDIPSALSFASEDLGKNTEQCRKCGYVYDVKRNRCTVCGTKGLDRDSQARSPHVGNPSQDEILMPLPTKQIQEKLTQPSRDNFVPEADGATRQSVNGSDSTSLDTPSDKMIFSTQHQSNGGCDPMTRNKESITVHNTNNTKAISREPSARHPVSPQGCVTEELNFTKIFSAFNLDPDDSGLRQISNIFGDTYSGVEMFMLFGDESYEDALHNFDLNSFARSNLRDFRMWFKTSYLFSRPESRPDFTTNVWLEYRESIAGGMASSASSKRAECVSKLESGGQETVRVPKSPARVGQKDDSELLKQKQGVAESPYAGAWDHFTALEEPGDGNSRSAHHASSRRCLPMPTTRKCDDTLSLSSSLLGGPLQTIDDVCASTEEPQQMSKDSVSLFDPQVPKSLVDGETLSLFASVEGNSKTIKNNHDCHMSEVPRQTRSVQSVPPSDAAMPSPTSRSTDACLRPSSVRQAGHSTEDKRAYMKRGCSAVSVGSVSVGGTRRKPHSKKATLSDDAGEDTQMVPGSISGLEMHDLRVKVGECHRTGSSNDKMDDADSLSTFSIPSRSGSTNVGMLSLRSWTKGSSTEGPSIKSVPRAVQPKASAEKVSGLASIDGSCLMDAARIRGAGQSEDVDAPISSVAPTSEEIDEDASAVTNNTCNRDLRVGGVRGILRKMRANPTYHSLQIHGCGELSHFLWDMGGEVSDAVVIEIARAVAPMIRDYAEDSNVLEAVLELTACLCESEKGMEIVSKDLEGLVLSMVVFPESTKIQMLASRVLCKLVQRPFNIGTVVFAGGIPILVSALKLAGCDEEVMKECCCAFLALGSNKNNLKCMIKEGVVEAVVSGLDHNMEDERAQELGTQVLETLVAFGENERLLNVDGLACVVRSMEEHSGNQPIQMSCCRIIGHVGIDESSNVQLVKGNGMCSVLRMLQAYRKTSMAQECALRALLSVLRDVVANRQWVVGAGGHNAILDALDTHMCDGQIALLGCRALRYCFTGTTINSGATKKDTFEAKGQQQSNLNRVFSAQDTIGILSRSMLQHGSAVPVQADGCFVLGQLTRWFGGRELVAHQEGVAAVLGALRDSHCHSDVQDHGVRALASVLGLHPFGARRFLQSVVEWSQQNNGFSSFDDLSNRNPDHGTAVVRIIIEWMKMHSSDEAVQQSGCKTLAELAVDLAVRESIIASNGIGAVLASIDQHREDAMMLVDGCRLLSLVAVSRSALIAAANGVSIMLAMMERHLSNCTLQATACKLLSVLAQESDAIKEIPKMGGIPIITSMMEGHASESEAIEIGCLTLLRLTPEKANIELLLDSNCVRVVVSKMELHLSNARIQTSGCLLLSRLVLCNADAITQILAANGVSTAVAAIQHHSAYHGLHKIGCLLLELLAEDDDACINVVAANGIPAILHTFMQNSSEFEFFEEGYSALCKLAGANTEECRSIAPSLLSWMQKRDSCSTIQSLVDLPGGRYGRLIACIMVGCMQHYKSDSRMQKDGIQALAKLADEGLDLHRLIAASNHVIRSSVSVMSEYSSVVTVQRAGCLLFSRLAEDEDCSQAIVLEKGVQAVLRAMQRFFDVGKLQRYGCITLAKLAAFSSSCLCIASTGGIHAVLKAMSHHAADQDIQVYGCRIMERLAAESPTCKYQIKQTGFVLLVKKAKCEFLSSSRLLLAANAALDALK